MMIGDYKSACKFNDKIYVMRHAIKIYVGCLGTLYTYLMNQLHVGTSVYAIYAKSGDFFSPKFMFYYLDIALCGLID